MLVVLDEEYNEEDERKKSKEPTTCLDYALAATFTHNSANPNVTSASSSAPVPADPSRSTRRLAQETRAETSGDSPSVEVVVSSSMKRIHKPPRPADWNVDHPRLLPRREGKRHLHTPTSSPRRKLQRVARDGDSSDEREQIDDSDDCAEIIVDVRRKLERASKAKLPRPPFCGPTYCLQVHFRAHLRIRVYTLDAPAAAALNSNTAKYQLTCRPPAHDPASTCTYRDHDTPARSRVCQIPSLTSRSRTGNGEDDGKCAWGAQEQAGSLLCRES